MAAKIWYWKWYVEPDVHIHFVAIVDYFYITYTIRWKQIQCTLKACIFYDWHEYVNRMAGWFYGLWLLTC